MKTTKATSSLQDSAVQGPQGPGLIEEDSVDLFRVGPPSEPEDHGAVPAQWRQVAPAVAEGCKEVIRGWTCEKKNRCSP